MAAAEQGAVAGLPRHALLEPQRAWPACFFILQIFHITPYNPRVGPPDSSIYLLSTPQHHTNKQQHNPQAFDSAASFAGEVRDPGRTYPRAMLAALAIIVGTNWVVVCGWMWGWGWNWTLWNGADGHLFTYTHTQTTINDITRSELHLPHPDRDAGGDGRGLRQLDGRNLHRGALSLVLMCALNANIRRSLVCVVVMVCDDISLTPHIQTHTQYSTDCPPSRRRVARRLDRALRRAEQRGALPGASQIPQQSGPGVFCLELLLLMEGPQPIFTNTHHATLAHRRKCPRTPSR